MTYEEAFTRLGLEQSATFADKVMASPWHAELLAGMPEHERHRYVYAQTGRTTAGLVWAAWRVSQGRKALVWCHRYQRPFVREKLEHMVRVLAGADAVHRVRVLERKPERRDVLGAGNLILMRDHAIEDVWDRDVVEIARFKGWEVR